MKILLILFLSISVLATERIIDLGKETFTDPFSGKYELETWKLAFNKAPEFGPFFIDLAKKLNISIAIETGTFEGKTSRFFSYAFDHVHTIENHPDVYKNTEKALQMFRNITCHFGSSDEVLQDLLPSLKEAPLLFYLDAHWRDPWPLLKELQAIGRTHRDNCIVIIDDFKVPGRPDIAYDVYLGNECSFEYIYESLNLVFSEYDYYFVIPRDPSCRAKFVAFPKKLTPLLFSPKF